MAGRRARPPLLILARSGRALAAAAQAAGYAPLVVDQFGDSDLRGLAAGLRVLPPTRDFRLAKTPVIEALAALARGRRLPLVWGGGLEASTSLLRTLAAHYELLGTPPAALAAVIDPRERHARLRALGIATPSLVFDRVPARGTWLRKCRGQAGGLHVRQVTAGARLGRNEYAEAFVPGRSMSVSFVASAGRVEVLGCCTHLFWPDAAAPFAWAGAVAGAPLPPALRRVLPSIVATFDLRGLCGLDFILQDRARWTVVDVNPRPTATVELLAQPASALRAHLAACRGDSWREVALRRRPRALAVPYVDDPIHVAKSLDWPAWVADRPGAGARLPRGAPLCSVSADGPTPTLACASLARRLQRLWRLLGCSAIAPPHAQQPALQR